MGKEKQRNKQNYGIRQRESVQNIREREATPPFKNSYTSVQGKGFKLIIEVNAQVNARMVF